MRKTNLLLFLSFFLILSCAKDEVNTSSVDLQTRAAADICHAEVIDAVNGIVAGSAKLVRTDSKVSMTATIEGLDPGYAYTMWWVIWNVPGNCATPNACSDDDFGIADAVQVEVIYAAGHVAGGSGKATFGGSLKENDNSKSINADFGLPDYGGLQDARAAEVHLVLRSHGPAVPGIIDEQIHTYGGGCDDYYGFPPFTEIPDEVGECGDYMFAIFSPGC